MSTGTILAAEFLGNRGKGGANGIPLDVDRAMCHDTIGLYAHPGGAGISASALALGGVRPGRPKTAI